MQETPLAKMAAQLIGSGLYDFAAITIVGVGALATYLAINVSSYQATTLNCIGAVSAALAGGVFRDTARAAKTIREVYRQEEIINRLVSQKNNKSSDEELHGRTALQTQRRTSILQQDTSSSNYSTEIKPSAFESIALDFGCSVVNRKDAGSPDTRVERMREYPDRNSKILSIASQQTLPIREAPSCPREAGTPEAVASFDRYLSPESQRIVDTRKSKNNDTFMPLQVSLRAFDDGADMLSPNNQVETLATVSVIGGSTQNQDLAFSSFQDVEQGGNYSNDTLSNPPIGLPPPPRVANRARAMMKR